MMWLLSAGSLLMPLDAVAEGLPAAMSTLSFSSFPAEATGPVCAPAEPLLVAQLRPQVQRQRLIPSQGKETVAVGAMRMFNLVEQGLAKGSVEGFSEHFAPSVSMQLRGGEGGHHSATQAYYILTSFLRTRKPVSVNLSTYGATDGVPYATGAATFALKGMREDLQVYIALHLSGERWMISHLNIY
jgi:hypothetical protein